MSQNAIELSIFMSIWSKISRAKEDAAQATRDLQRSAVQFLRGEIDEATWKNTLAECELLQRQAHVFETCEYDLRAREKKLSEMVSHEKLYGHLNR